MTEGRPTGRDEVMEAVLAAAERLFGERGVAAVSLREIAREAGVNHGLLHRHFGNKDALLAALFERSSREGAARLRSTGTVEAALADLMTTTATSSYVQLLAAALDAGARPAVLASDGEATQALVDLLIAQQAESGDATGCDPRLVAAATFSLVTGWRYFGPFVAATVGLGSEPPPALDEQLTALLARMVSSLPIAAPGDEPENGPGS